MKKFKRAYQDIITVDNLLHAWEQFLPGKKKRTDVIEFQNRLMNNLFDLHRALVEKTFIHGAYHAFNISDPKPRNIHKATVRDRLLHHLIHSELYGYFDQKFIYDSYSCRIEKGTHRAMNRFREFGRIVSKNNTRTCWVLKCDIRKFFANIDHNILKSILGKHIDDKDVLNLLNHLVDSFSTPGKKDVGLPLGNLTSQLLVNIYMNEFDQFMKRTIKTEYYMRYADDFVILHESREYLSEMISNISEFLESHLKLSLHPDKLFLETLVSGVDFLGWVHFPHHRVLRTATKRRMLRNVRNSEDLATFYSYEGMLAHGNGFKLIRKAESSFSKVFATVF
ncbi:MAG: reverse transcriptase/maturase family protein [Candidatus Uhrbacteria bacterium]|nr:reverse transcriptase/maturase family protein [Candidatus Uhrbacteria bacterium]